MNKHKRIKYSLNDIVNIPSSFLQKGKGPKYITVKIGEDNKMYFHYYYSDKIWAKMGTPYGQIILKRTWDKQYIFWRYGNQVFGQIHGDPITSHDNNDGLWAAAAAANVHI